MSHEARERDGEREVARAIAARSVERALGHRQALYRDEVERLIRAGVRVMQRHGDFDPRVSEVVREAGLSNQVFYRHFRSKDEFLLAVLDDGVRDLVGYLEHRMAGADTPAERVRRWLGGIVAQARNPEAAEATRPFVIPRARLAERFPDDVGSSIERLLAPLRAAIEDGVAAGELPGADPARDARALYDLAMGWLERSLLCAADPALADAERLIAFSLRGLGAAPARD